MYRQQNRLLDELHAPSKVSPELVNKQEGHDGPVLLHWLICKIPSYRTLKYMGIGLKHKTPKKD